MYKNPLSFLFILVLFNGCTESPEDNKTNDLVPQGLWRVSLNLGDKELPFQMQIEEGEGSNSTATIFNGSERLEKNPITFRNDSVIINIRVFDSKLEGRIEASGLISGVWIKNSNKDRSIPFVAEYGKNFRFSPLPPSSQVANRYKVSFTNPDSKTYMSVLMLENKDSSITGTFLTEMGDYRFLEGTSFNNTLFLSSFDGSNAYYFEANIKGDSLLNGVFLSGSRYREKWKAAKNNSFELSNPDSLTSIKPAIQKFDFQILNEEGDSVSYEDLNLENKVVIIEIMGSWCPNCMDASKALKIFEEKYAEKGLIILPVAFERSNDFKKAKESVNKAFNDLEIDYPFLLGGRADKEAASKAFPMLTSITSFPTMIFIDRKREIRKIHTGFYGPGTGKYYEEFMQETDQFIQSLLEE